MLCQGQRAIITENRRDLGSDILRCAGASAQGGVNWSNLLGDGRLFDGALPLGALFIAVGVVGAGEGVEALQLPGNDLLSLFFRAAPKGTVEGFVGVDGGLL